VDAAKSGLKKMYANWPQNTLAVRFGGSVLEILKNATTPAGDWFGIERTTSAEALDIAVGMSSDKVKPHLQ